MTRKPEEIAEKLHEIDPTEQSPLDGITAVAQALRDYGNEALERAAKACDALENDARRQARYAAASGAASVQRDYEARAEAANNAAYTIRALKEKP